MEVKDIKAVIKECKEHLVKSIKIDGEKVEIDFFEPPKFIRMSAATESKNLSTAIVEPSAKGYSDEELFHSAGG